MKVEIQLDDINQIRKVRGTIIGRINAKLWRDASPRTRQQMLVSILDQCADYVDVEKPS